MDNGNNIFGRKHKALSVRPYYIVLLLIISSLTTYAQTEKDFRERVSPWFWGVTVVPDGGLWYAFEQQNRLYHAEDIHSLWHQVKTIGKEKQDSENNNVGGKMTNIVCPDSNTVLVFGTLHNPFLHKKIDKYYWYSGNKGKTWESRVFAANKQIVNCTFCAPSGEVWVAGDTLYYSADKGVNFVKVNHFPKNLASISMNQDLRTGIAGCYDNAVFYTEDNWATYRSLPTPDDQHLLRQNTPRARKDYRYNRCMVTGIFKQWLMVHQGDEWFYTSRQKIKWERFPSGLKLQTKDMDNDLLLVTTEAGDILQTADLQHFDTIFHTIGVVPSALRVCNGKLYGYITTDADNYFCLFTGDSCIRMGFFSDDHPIKAPWERATTKDDWYLEDEDEGEEDDYDAAYPWGWTQKDILHFDTVRRQWYRVTTTPFSIAYMYPYSDQQNTAQQQVIVSDGKKLYVVSENEPQLKPVHIERPLDHFLQFPVIQVVISPYTQGCFHYWGDIVNYNRNGNLFVAQNVRLHDSIVAVDLAFPVETLDSLLRDLNLHYDTAITQGMFAFSQADYDTVKSYYERYPERLFEYASKQDILHLKDSVAAFSDSLLDYILTTGFRDGCTTTSYFVAKIVNSNGDKLFINGHDATCSLGGEHPYMLPVELRIGECILPCTHIPFLRFLGDAMPSKMLTKHNFSDVDVLLKCLRYLTQPREEWEW